MCGIFGLVVTPESQLQSESIVKMLERLFKLSESRGGEAAGIAIGGATSLQVFRRAQPASRMILTDDYKQFITANLTSLNRASGLAVIGHSRLVTNGSQGMEENNQPVSSAHCIGVHNGIVVNEAELWAKHTDLLRKSQVDTEIIFQLIDKYYTVQGGDLPSATINTYKQLQGEANIAFLHDTERALCLATNVGSLYFTSLLGQGIFVFASEKHFLKELLGNTEILNSATDRIEQLRSNQALIVKMSDLSQYDFFLKNEISHSYIPIKGKSRTIIDQSTRQATLKRCSKCVLPHTFPYIEFDEQGVCNYCREDQPSKVDDRSTLESVIAKYRSTDGSPDCIVALSGGRDSCYGLHVVKRELGLNPIAYTYDWAMVTDEARRNSARVCGELGVEHIIRSADILTKRRNIRLNIEAWLKKPVLGMIPLFMAGDKQFFHYATQVSKQTGVPLVIFCGGNNLEITRFKTGFCGVQDRSTNTMVGLDQLGKIKLLAFYAKNFLLNPRYLNRSIFDTLFAFYSTYVSRQEFLYLYKYVDWDEKVIADTLAKYYGWESSPNSASTWRIGDGTAAFYNYIYYTVAGFSEHDTFRSNQIRAGLITRQRALTLLEEENKPRYAAMQDYANLVGFSLDEALVVINNIPKLTRLIR
jgi:glucosamine--fructose-6-phosphate aminotransferase (isomerizing)